MGSFLVREFPWVVSKLQRADKSLWNQKACRAWCHAVPSSAWQPVLLSGPLFRSSVFEWFVEPLLSKEDMLNRECQKLKLNFRIYYRSKLPFALLKMQVFQESLKAVLDVVSEEKATALETFSGPLTEVPSRPHRPRWVGGGIWMPPGWELQEGRIKMGTVMRWYFSTLTRNFNN